MTTSFNSEENFNDLVFENRNKEYGAYVIRRNYTDTVSRSLLITFGSMCMIALAAFLFNKGSLITKQAISKIDSIVSIPFVIDPNTIDPPKDPGQVVKPKDPTPTKVDVIAGVVTDKKTDDNLKSNVDATVAIGDPKGKTDSAPHIDPVVNVEPPKTTTTSTTINMIADVMPELKGLGPIIAANLNYPEIAKENGTIGVVYLSFVVEKDGSVSDVKILKGIGDGCEQEAVRVVKALPKWTPGKIHGEPVRVLFTLPVKFRLQ